MNNSYKSRKAKGKQAERILKALASTRRLWILGFLSSCDGASVGEVADKLDIAFATASQHLRVLEAANVLERQREYNRVYYRVCRSTPFVRETLEQLK